MGIRMLASAAVVGAMLISPALAQDSNVQDSNAQDANAQDSNAKGENVLDMSGRYSVTGEDKEGNVKYEGEGAIAKRGDTYHVAWAVEDHFEIGTGILTRDFFAVTYLGQGVPVPGIALFERQPTGAFTVHYTLLGADQVGRETWTPVKTAP